MSCIKEFRKFPQFKTTRLILRQMRPSDAEFYFHHFNISEIVEGCCFPGPASLDVARAELELYCVRPFKERRGFRWGIAQKGSTKLIGTLGYYDWDKTARRAEIGYDLDPAYWGQGIMTEALHAVLKFGFETMLLNRVQAIIDSENTRSMRLVVRLGFVKEGFLRERTCFNGKFRDDVCLSLLRREWTKS